MWICEAPNRLGEAKFHFKMIRRGPHPNLLPPDHSQAVAEQRQAVEWQQKRPEKRRSRRPPGLQNRRFAAPNS
jgi:hypothetical protein